MDARHAGVRGVIASFDQPGVTQPVDELDRSMRHEDHFLGEVLDHQAGFAALEDDEERLILLRGQADSAGDAFAEAQKLPDPASKVGERADGSHELG
jgi:hypothetical protein